VVDGGAPLTILHASQLAAAVGLPAPPGGDSVRHAWETLSILRGWLDHLEGVDESFLIEPISPRRGYTFRVIAVNVFNPFALLPEAWETGTFDWQPERDAEVEAELGSTGNVTAFARRIYGDWADFVLGRSDELAGGDREVTSSRGVLAYSEVLASQRWHAAVHYRQLVETLRERGVVIPGAFSLDTLPDLELPEAVF
jgi:hypothetical protein